MNWNLIKKSITILILTINVILFIYPSICFANITPGISDEDKLLEEDKKMGNPAKITQEATITPTEEGKKNYSLGDAIQQAISFINGGRNKAQLNETEIKKVNDAIFNLLLIIGTVLALIIGGVIGIQFMLASVEDKAKIKETMIPYVLGCVIVFGAFGIWKLVVTILARI